MTDYVILLKLTGFLKHMYVQLLRAGSLSMLYLSAIQSFNLLPLICFQTTLF